jgi:hypothetical protein
MKVSEKWSITGGRCDFVLTKLSVRVDNKTGKESATKHQSFHSSVEQCLVKIVRSETQEFVQTEDGQTVQQLHELLTNIMADIRNIAVELNNKATKEEQ